MTGVIKRGKFTDTHTERTPCKYQGRDQGSASTSQGVLKTARIPPGTEFSSQLSEETNPADILILLF